MKPAVLLITLSCAAGPATAAVEVNFRDGNPWDIFTISVIDCPVQNARLTIDMTTSAAGAVIDTEYGGPGVQDPMPAELATGDAILLPVMDGDQILQIGIASLTTDTSISLQMDLDDTIGATAGVSVSPAEFAGTIVTLSVNEAQTTGVFDTEGSAIIPLPDSVSGCLNLS